MNAKIYYSFLLLASLFTCFTGPLQAQDPYLQHESRNARERANQLMELYKPELGMTVDQAFLFRNKAEEFVIRRNRIQDMDVGLKEKLHLLQELSDQETAEMGNILTLPQLRAYQKLKLKIQPVAVTVEEGSPPGSQ